MEKKNANSNEKFYEFNSFLNKVIIFSGKEFFRKELKNKRRELDLIDDDNFENMYLNSYLCEDQTSKDVFDFINFCENFNLHCALKSLSAIEQEVLFLLYSKELSQEEVANILNICSKYVSRKKLRAFDKIRKFLSGLSLISL